MHVCIHVFIFSLMDFPLHFRQDLTELENSMVNIIKIFHSYSGENCKLRKGDLKELINTQLSTFVKIQDSETLDIIFTDLDENHDQEIDFSEYAALIAMVTSACHKSFHED
ncbi:protein S100-B isoform X2 [Xenopus tropicalis]|uniref:Protein S100 n=1 Tax=Xenopus tropicalis TaxID=8364 RepID=A0A803JAF7_XENTR|nr:protein S100-B isoform X2 [Xenopus tropicalis]